MRLPVLARQIGTVSLVHDPFTRLQGQQLAARILELSEAMSLSLGPSKRTDDGRLVADFWDTGAAASFLLTPNENGLIVTSNLPNEPESEGNVKVLIPETPYTRLWGLEVDMINVANPNELADVHMERIRGLSYLNQATPRDCVKFAVLAKWVPELPHFAGFRH